MIGSLGMLSGATGSLGLGGGVGGQASAPSATSGVTTGDVTPTVTVRGGGTTFGSPNIVFPGGELTSDGDINATSKPNLALALGAIVILGGALFLYLRK